MSSGVPSRDLLSKVFKDHEQLRAFEELFRISNETTPAQIGGLGQTTLTLSEQLAVATDTAGYAVGLAGVTAADVDEIKRRLTAIEAYLGL